MTGTMTRQLSKNEAAFSAVMAVGRDYAQRIEDAQIAGDTVAEAMAVNFGMVEMQDAIAAHEGASDVIARAAGHKWGFRTSRDKKDGTGTEYERGVIIANFCQAALMKLKAVGNEFNIIEGGLYVTKEGWQGKLDRLPGVTEIDIRSGAITHYDEKEYTTKIGTTREGRQYGGEHKIKLVAYVSATASCKVWGEPVEVQAWLQPNGQDERYQVTGTADIVEQMIDQLRGKAEARISERLFMKCVGLSRRGPQSDAKQPPKQIAVKESQAVIEVASKPVQTEDEPPEQKPAKLHRSPDKFEADRCEMINRFTDGTQAETWQGLWAAFKKAKHVTALKAAAEDAKGAKDLFGEAAAELLGDWYLFRLAQLKGEVK